MSDIYARHFPALSLRTPRIALGSFPTPIERLPLPGLPADVELWVKRDDLTGEPYGGNKVRKLEFVLGEARASGRKRVVTVGGFGSHHVVATGIYGRRAGLHVEALVSPQPLSPHVLETMRAGAAAGVEYRPSPGWTALVPRIAAARAQREVFWIPAGGSSVAGTLGYVGAALEIAEAIGDGACPDFDVIYVGLGTGGTAAGLWAGLRLAGIRARVVAVRVVDRVIGNAPKVRRLAHGAMERLGRSVRLDGLELRQDQAGPGYGVATAAALDAAARADRAGLPLETTYTGKTLAAVIADAAAGKLSGQRALFVDTFNSRDLGGLLASGAAEAPWAGLPPAMARCFST